MSAAGGSGQQHCTWHPQRATALTCSRCGRPACPDCLTPASVGFHCRACVTDARAAQRSAAPRTVVGARAPHTRTAGRFQPHLTYAIIAINVVVFLLVAVQAGSSSGFGNSPIFNGSVLIPMTIAGGEWWRLVTSGFLHLSITHIALNMAALYFIGMGLERVLGAWRYLTLYGLSLLGGSAAVMVFAPINSGAAGASGAIFGLMGALLVTMHRLKLDLRQVGAIIVLNVVITFVIPGISWQAHLGGLVVGALVGAAMVYAPAKNRFAWQLGACLLIGASVVAVIVLKDLSLGPRVCIDTFTPYARCSAALRSYAGL